LIIPFLAFHSGEDECIDPPTSKLIYSKMWVREPVPLLIRTLLSDLHCQNTLSQVISNSSSEAGKINVQTGMGSMGAG
jgi:hypothetical protein